MDHFSSSTQQVLAVHPSGQVFIVDEFNHHIQVLHPNLSLSHMFGSKLKVDQESLVVHMTWPVTVVA